MKQILPLLLLATSAISTFAAPHNKKTNTQHQAIYTAILQKQSTSNSVNKTTAIQRRLIANAYTVNGILTDTNHYYYSNGRGSSLSDATSYYDDFYITAIDPVHTLQCDSSTNSHFYSGQWYKSGTRSYTYDANNRITKMLSQSYSYITSYLPTYNTSGKMDTIVMADTMASVPSVKPKTKMYIVYDVLGRRIKDQTNKIDGSLYTKREYTYDANGNRVRFDSYQYNAGSWELTYKNQNSYDASNRLSVSTSEIDFGTGSGLEKSSKDSFAYVGSNTKPYYHISFQWDTNLGDWVADEIILNQYNAVNLIDTYYIIRYTSQWDTIERDVYTYDSDNFILSSNGYSYIGNGTYSATPYDQTTMYYENYFPANISSTSTSQHEITVFPNPSSNTLNITTSYTGKYTLSIYNTTGQVMYYQTNITDAQTIINTSAYSPGNYIIHISAITGATIAQKQFIKD
jgi:hypothetical protein